MAGHSRVSACVRISEPSHWWGGSEVRIIRATNFGIGVLAGLLLGKTRLNWLYGLKQNLIASCATVLATPIRPVFAE
jgi:hypothetical protein